MNIMMGFFFFFGYQGSYIAGFVSRSKPKGYGHARLQWSFPECKWVYLPEKPG